MSVEALTAADTTDHGELAVKLGFIGIFAVQALWLLGLAWVPLWAFGFV
jgi:hypothetical protein